jgi:hypothetical protein
VPFRLRVTSAEQVISKPLGLWRFGVQGCLLDFGLTSAPVAQRTEQEPSKLLVGGSNPPGGARDSNLITVAVAQLG